jgi:hypothetical protein
MKLAINQPTQAFQLLRKLATNQLRGPEIESAFAQIAIELLLHTKIICGHHEWVIQELEFYYHSPQAGHPDPYCERHDRRRHFACWNFQGYEWKRISWNRVDTQRSLELTFGNYHLGIYGGITVRKVMNLSDGSIIDGRDAIVKEIQATLGEKPVLRLGLSRYYQIFLGPNDAPHAEGLNLRAHSLSPRPKVMRETRKQMPNLLQDDLGYRSRKYRYFTA